MKLYKFLLTLILLFLTTNTLKAQTFLYTYTDPCTGLLKSLTVPSNGVTVTYFNQIQTFSPQDFQNGVFDTWATGVLNSYGNANPCGSVLGVSTSVDVAQGSAMSFISIINNLTAVSELQSAMGGGSLNTMSVIESAKSSSGGKKDKKDKDNNNSNQSTATTTTTTTTTNQSSNQSGVSSESSQNSQTNSESQNVQSSQSVTNNQTTSNQSGQSSQNGEAGQNSTSSSNQIETGVTQNASQTSSETGQINSTGQVGQTTSQASGNGSNQESGEQNQTTSNQTGGESGQTSSTESQNNSTNSTQANETTNNTNGESSSGSSENGTENQTNNTENPTSSTNSSSSGGSGTGSNGGANENPPDNSQNTTETTEDKKTNVLGGTVNSSQRSTEGNKPQIVLSSDFAGFNFKDKEVTFGGKGTAGWTSLSWDGRKSYGVLLDYTSVIKGPNITGFYANMAKRRIDLISATGTISFYGRGSQYGTLAVGQMWSFPKVKNLKAIYLATGSFGNVYGEKFLGTAMIAGGMYDWKVSKRIDIKMMNLFIYAPYVSYYNDILLKSPYVIMPIIGTNIGITKKFKFNVNFGGAYAITQNVMNFTVMFGTRFAL